MKRKITLLLGAVCLAFTGFSQTPVIYTDDFETGPGGWVINDLSGNSSWAFGTPANTIINMAASGDSAFVTNLTGNYAGGEDGNVTSPMIDVSARETRHSKSVIVSMNVWWNSEFSWDGANLFSSADSGTTWQIVGDFGDPNNWYTDNTINSSPNGSQIGWTGRNSSGNGSGGWVTASNRIDSNELQIGADLLLRVGFGSDGSVFDEGFAFDDVSVALPYLNDLTVSAINLPFVCTYGTAETIDITVCHLGDTVYPIGTVFPVSYAISGGTPVMENITLTAPLFPDSCINYSFTALADLAPATVGNNFDLDAWTSFAGELNVANDTASSNRLNFLPDVGVTSLILPNGCGLTATEQIEITVCNFGADLFVGDVIPVSYALDGGATVTEMITLTSNLDGICAGNPGACANYTFTATVDLTATGAHTAVAWTALANDNDSLNDTTTTNSTTINTDLGVTIVSGPSGIGLGTTEQIDVTICNFGDTLAAGTMIPVSYTINGGTPVTEMVTLAATLGGVCGGSIGGCVTYSFMATADLSATGTYTVAGFTALGADDIAANDTTVAFLVNTPTLPIPYFENFEGGTPGAWLIDNVNNGSWEFGTPSNTVINGAVSGSNAFATNLDGNYNANEDGNVTSPLFDITTANGSELVTMKVWWNSEFSWDGANLFSSVDSGATWTSVGNVGDPTNWYNDNTINSSPQGSQEGWTGRNSSGNGSDGWICAQHILDSAMMVDNSSLMLRVGFGSDGSVNDEGFAFDDVAIGYPIVYDGLVDSVLAICDNQYTIDAGAGYLYYRWSTGETTQTITVNGTGTYSVTVSDTTGICASDTTFIELLDFERPSLIDLLTCINDTAVFDAGSGVIPTNLTYTWSTGQTAQIGTLPTGAGTIVVIKTDTATGCIAMDTAVSINNIPVSLSDLSICAGDTAVIDLSSLNGTSYLWSTGDSTSVITSAVGGVITLTFTDTIGCISVDSLVLTVNTLPVVDLGSDTTVCDTAGIVLDAVTGASFVWQDGSMNQTFTPTDTITDTYFVTVTDSNGCSASDSIVVTVDVCVGFEELFDGANVNLYPNPTKGNLTLSLSKLTDNGTITISNIYGQVVRVENVNSTKTNLDLTGLAKGTYTFKLQVNESVLIDKFIIN